MPRRGRPRARKPNSAHPGPYRLSDVSIRRWTRGLLAILIGGAVIGIGITITGAVRRDDDLIYGGVGIVMAFIVVTLIPAAWLGGQALAPFGGLFGMLLLVGIGGAAGGWSFGPLWGWAGVVVFFIAVGGFFWMRRRWRALLPASHR